MQKVRFVGLDVHKESIAIAVADGDGGAPEKVATIPNDVSTLLKRLKKVGAGSTLRCCYEAGPTGFALHRAVRAAGLDCIVIAPSLVPQKAGDRVKTESRDAVKLARFLRSGDLTEVHVPEAATEAMRDLERSRDDAKKAERTARHQLSKFLLRYGRRYAGKTAWTGMHLDWIRKQVFDYKAHNRVLVDYVHAVECDGARRKSHEGHRRTRRELELAPPGQGASALRGIQIISAVVLAAEVADFARFASAPALMAYIGLVPSEHSSGESQKRGRITGTATSMSGEFSSSQHGAIDSDPR